MMKRILLSIFVFGTVDAYSQTNHAVLIDSFMNAQARIKKFNGNVLVADGGNIIYQQAFGVRNYYTNEPLDNHSIFELASVSKQFTAMGILLLVDKGKIKLSDSLRHFFPQLPFGHVTVHHLLTHTGGLPEYESVMIVNKWDKKKIAFNKDVIELYAEKKPRFLFKPGKEWRYSNTGYMLLASIIEKVTGQTFHDYMAANIFRPLQMNNTRVYNTRRSTGEVIPNYAFGFVTDPKSKDYTLPDSLPNLDFVYWLDGIQGDGIINSTTEDLLKWDRALKNSTLLKKETQAKMLSPQAIADTATNTAYGYGVVITSDSTDTYISHSGGWPGYYTFLSRMVNRDITIAVLSNNSSNSANIAASLGKILRNEYVMFPYEHIEIKVDSMILDKYTGKYEGTTKIEIIREGEKLFRKNASGRIQLKPETETKFFYADDSDRVIEFQLSDGKISGAMLYSGDQKIFLKKL